MEHCYKTSIVPRVVFFISRPQHNLQTAKFKRFHFFILKFENVFWNKVGTCRQHGKVQGGAPQEPPRLQVLILLFVFFWIRSSYDRIRSKWTYRIVIKLKLSLKLCRNSAGYNCITGDQTLPLTAPKLPEKKPELQAYEEQDRLEREAELQRQQ